MKWDTDSNKYIKYTVFDAIIEFSRQFTDKAASEISIRELREFVDEFIENQKNTL